MIIAAPFSAIIMVGALVLPEVMVGMTEASTTRSRSCPMPRSRSTAAVLAPPPEPVTRRLQVAHARRERGKFGQWVAEFVERERLHVELDVGALARCIRARE